MLFALRDNNEYPLVVDYNEYYYYSHIRHKMSEVLSVNNCTVSYSNMALSNSGDFHVEIIPPSKNIIEKWGPSNEAISRRIFAHVSSGLCGSNRFKAVKSGNFRRAKGCYKVFKTDKRGRRVKRINTYGATLHPEHVRCDLTEPISICGSSAASTGLKVIPAEYRSLNAFPFKISANHVLISRSGMFDLPCGPVGLYSSCEAVKWGLMTADMAMNNVTGCRLSDPWSDTVRRNAWNRIGVSHLDPIDVSKHIHSLQHNNQDLCPFPKHEKVFIMTQYDDTQIGQFMQEALPKLIYHLDYLLANPEVKIHYGFTKKSVLPKYVLPHNFLNWLGLKDRFINGTVYAKEIIMPREGGCQDIGYNAWEVVTMREKFLEFAGIREDKDFRTKNLLPSERNFLYKDIYYNPGDYIQTNDKPSLVLLRRSPGSFTQNKSDANRRRWPPEQYELLLSLLSSKFPNHRLEIFSDANSTLMTCPLCQAMMFNRAEIVIGFHGAGLSNAMFMKPGGIMIEVMVDFDSRHAPVVGIFPRLSSIIGLHHYTYYANKEIGVNVTNLVEDVVSFASKAKLFA